MLYKAQQDKLCNMKAMINAVKLAGKEEGIWVSKKEYMVHVMACNYLFDDVEKYFRYKYNESHVRQHEQLLWKNVFNQYQKMGIPLHCFKGIEILAADIENGEFHLIFIIYFCCHSIYCESLVIML